MKVVPARDYKQFFSDELLEEFNLYSHPEFLSLVAPANSFYGILSSGGQIGAVFPFTGKRLFWKWHIHQVAFCQKYKPVFLSPVESEPQVAWEAWFTFLKQSWFVRWPFEAPPFFNSSAMVRPRVNQYFSFYQSEDQIRSGWKKNRIQALKKSAGVEVRPLSNEGFKTCLLSLSVEKRPGIWAPDAREQKVLLALSDSGFFCSGLSRFGLFDEGKSVGLILLLEWKGRLHYLFSQSTLQSYKSEALTQFFSFLISTYAGRELVFDFEGSNLPGVQAYFKSLGAQSESYSLFEKGWSL